MLIPVFHPGFAAGPPSTAGLSFSSQSQCPFGTILQTTYSMVSDSRVSRAGIIVFYWPKLLYPYYILLLFFSFLFFLSIGWYCGAGVISKKNTHISMISNSVTHLQLYQRNNRRYYQKLRARSDIICVEPPERKCRRADNVASNGEHLSVSWCFTMF